MVSTLHLDRLPRTVALARSASGVLYLSYVDQRKLPERLVIERTGDWRSVVDAIKTLAVRGAPAIGVAGAAAVALWVYNESVMSGADGKAVEESQFLQELAAVADEVMGARPTANNLAWGVDQIVRHTREVVANGARSQAVADESFECARELEAADEATNRALGAHGASLLPNQARVLTHCNAGSLATVFYGTALGVVYAAAERGGVTRVYADETRPVGQGVRLTSWELARAGVPCTLICDDMAASLMAHGEVDAVVVGADRIAANGDVANKIGTYGVAVLARYHGIPFYVAAPNSTIDLGCPEGLSIPIEERDPVEVLPQAIEGVKVWNPAFDITPARLVTRFITENGVFRPEELLSGLSTTPLRCYTEQ